MPQLGAAGREGHGRRATSRDDPRARFDHEHSPIVARRARPHNVLSVQMLPRSTKVQGRTSGAWRVVDRRRRIDRGADKPSESSGDGSDWPTVENPKGDDGAKTGEKSTCGSQSGSE